MATAGVLAKESALAVLGLILVLELIWWTRGRSARMLATTAALCAVPLAAWAVHRGAVLAAGKAAEFPFTDNPIVGATFWQGRITAVQVMWRYVTLLAWPARLSADYSYPQISLAHGTAVRRSDAHSSSAACSVSCGRFDGVASHCSSRRSRSSRSCRSRICSLRPAPSWVSGSCICRLLDWPCCLRSRCTLPRRPHHRRASGRRRPPPRSSSWRSRRERMRANRDWTDDVTVWRSTVQRGAGEREGPSRPGGSVVRRGPDPYQHRRGHRGGRQERGAARRAA